MVQLTRRGLGQFLLSLGLPCAAWSRSTAPVLSIADISNDVSINLKDAPQRFDIYRSLGFTMLRTAIGWQDFERSKSKWDLSPARRKYLDLAAKSGLKLKLEIGAWSSAPGWFFDDHPDARLRNGHGVSPRTLISPWFPDAASIIADKQDRIVASLAEAGPLDHVAAVIASLGPAGEPIFPASWEIEDKPPPTFWFYDRRAQAAFPAAMQTRYGGVEAANEKWGTSFGGWSDVRLPEPRTVHGAHWADVLTWYRDSKRALVESTLTTLQSTLAAHGKGATRPVIILVPGSHITTQAWNEAVAAGDGDDSVKVMIDTDDLLDLAKRTGAWLQYTAGQNEKEIRYVLAGMTSRGFQTPLWAENAGGKAALDPDHLADVIVRNHLYGLDYINGSTLFAADHITPGPLMPRLRAASETMQRASPRN